MSSLQESPTPKKRGSPPKKRGTPPEKRVTPPSLIRHQATPRTPLNRSHLTSPTTPRSNKLGCKRRLLDSPLSTSSPRRKEKKSLSELFQNHLPVAAPASPVPIICEREKENQAPDIQPSPPRSKTLLPYNPDQYPGSFMQLIDMTSWFWDGARKL